MGKVVLLLLLALPGPSAAALPPASFDLRDVDGKNFLNPVRWEAGGGGVAAAAGGAVRVLLVC
jgi:hypothetical protein